MKRGAAVLFGAVILTLSAMTFPGASIRSSAEACPLIGTPLCPQYPSCCK